MSQGSGKLMIFIGLMIVLAGVVVYFFGDKFGWVGRLPGDIRIEKENTRFYFPITTMILFSIVLSVLMWIYRQIM